MFKKILMALLIAAASFSFGTTSEAAEGNYEDYCHGNYYGNGCYGYYEGNSDSDNYRGGYCGGHRGGCWR